MNLQKLFETQRILDEKIVKEKGLEGQDLLDKKILALQVELGELAQNWRGFKFWSKDQEPRTWYPNEKDVCESCKGEPIFIENGKIIGQCEDCDGCGVHFHNPLLEEYVDCLHFILSIGLEIKYQDVEPFVMNVSKDGITEFNLLFANVSGMWLSTTTVAGMEHHIKEDYRKVISIFIELGKFLGFTWEEIERAYYTKNKENHERQKNGY